MVSTITGTVLSGTIATTATAITATLVVSDSNGLNYVVTITQSGSTFAAATVVASPSNPN